MNKFLTRVKGGSRKMAAPVRRSVREVNQEDLDALQEFANDWSSLEEMRRKTRRSVMYAWGDQWGDLVRDPDTGQMMTEGDLLKKNDRPKQRSCAGGYRKAAQQWSLARASGLRKGLPRNLALHKIKLNYYICEQI